MSHTPGEWVMKHVGSGGQYDNPTDIYEVCTEYARIAEYLTEDDARLVASAPNLLAALNLLLYGTDCELDNEGRSVFSFTTAKLAQARAALAKAQGK